MRAQQGSQVQQPIRQHRTTLTSMPYWQALTMSFSTHFPSGQTAGTWHDMAIELTQEIGRRITAITEDTSKTTFLFQRLSIDLQRGNAVSFHFCSA